LTHGTITFEPGRKGRTVSVERQSDDGRWVKVASGRQGSTGKFGFWAKLSNGTTYRATAAKSKGARWVGSNPSVYASFPLKLDEGFTTSGIDADPDYWSDRQTGTRLAHTRKVSMSHPNATSVVDGKLQVRVQKGRDDYKNFNAYTKKEWARHTLKYINGHVSTENKFSFKYGFAAARVNFAKNRGQHGSFWLQHPSSVQGDEIDTVEFFGKGYPKRGLSHFIHTPYKKKTTKIGGLVDSHKWFAKGKTPYNSYHVYSVEWTPRKYVFRMDGHVAKTINRRTTSKQEQFIVISQLTSDWELEEVDRKGRSSLRKALKSEIAAGGSKTHVDWVKVWVDPKKGTYSDASKGISKQQP
ncbi:MAG TPA: glycoside hydrolase family 16 protein, partial [Aeromicrobium sp.]|nr:glycoside hydrolase family 16 protein [Aeromicrobium sp.]